MTLDSLEILLTQPDFAQPPRISGRRGISLFARGQARRFGMFPTGGVRHVLAHRHVFDSREGARELEDFFNARRGQLSGFFVPGWHAELEPRQTIEAGATALAVSQVNYAAVYLDTAKKTRTGHYIYLLNEAGDFHATKVLSATTGATEILTLRDAVPDGMSFQLGRYHVGFLYNVRFMADVLALEFSGPEFVTCETSMLELMEQSAVVPDEIHEPEPSPGPDGGTNSEAGSSGNNYWLRCECPITAPPYGCPATAMAELTLPNFGGPRLVQCRIRGVAETHSYSGGEYLNPGSRFYTGGVADPGPANIFKLTVGPNHYFINANGPGGGVGLIDITVGIPMDDGQTIRLEYDSVDNLEYYNSGITVPGVPPYPDAFNGQFAQVDFTL